MKIGFLLLGLMLSQSGLADICARSPGVIRALEHSFQKKCQDIQSSDLLELDLVLLVDNGGAPYSVGDFAGLTKLKALVLGGTPAAMPETLFQGLTSLESIWIITGGENFLPEKIFHGLNQLQIATLQSTQMRHLPKNIFQGLPKLNDVRLAFNKFMTLPTDFFQPLNLKKLVYEQNLTSLTESMLTGQKALESLEISVDNQFSEDLFKSIPQIKTLQLHIQTPMTLSSSFLKSFSGLEYFSVTAYTIGTPLRLSDDFFTDQKFLSQISMTQIELKNGLENLFSGLSQLASLDLSYNRLSALPSGLFAGLSSLYMLNLSNNQLSTLPEDLFKDLSGLYHLNLNQNELSFLPEKVFAPLTGLDSLQIRDNKLSEVEKDKIRRTLIDAQIDF